MKPSTTHSRWHSATSLILVFLGLSLIGASMWKWQASRQPSPSSASVIRLPVDIWPGTHWMLVANQLGYFKDEGLNVELVDISDDYIAATEILAKDPSAAVSSPSFFDLMRLNATGADLVALFVSDLSERGEGIMAKDPSITDLAQLKGKKIGVQIGAYVDFLLDTALLANDISLAEVTKVDTKVEQLGDKYGSGEVDAVAVWEPTLSQIKDKHGGNILFDPSKIEGFSINVFTLHRDFIQNRPKDVARLVKIWAKTVAYMKSHPEETVNLISAFPFKSKLPGYHTPDAVRAMLAIDRVLGPDDNFPLFNYSSGFDSVYGNLQYAFRYFQRKEGTDPNLKPEDMINRYFIMNFK